MRKNSFENFTYEELGSLLLKSNLERDDAIYEKKLYSADSQKIRHENTDLKQRVQFLEKEHEKTFIEFCKRLFPKFILEHPPSRHCKMHVIRDLSDGMFGIVRAGFGTTLLICFMEDETERTIPTDKGDWIL